MKRRFKFPWFIVIPVVGFIISFYWFSATRTEERIMSRPKAKPRKATGLSFDSPVQDNYQD